MKKKVISIVLCVVMLFSVSSMAVFAEDTIKTYTLTLDDAIKMAVEKSPAFMSSDVSMQNAERQLENAYKEQRNLKGAIKLPEAFASIPVKQGYYVEQAKIGVESAKLSRTQLESQTAYAITQYYYSVKLGEKLLETAQTAYNLALDNKNTVDMQFSLGMVSQVDVKNAQYSLNEAKASVNKYSRNLEIARKTLANELFIEDDNVNFVLTDDITYEEFTTNLQEDILKAIDSRYDVYQLKSAKILAEKYTNSTILLGYSSAQHFAAIQSKVAAESNYNITVKRIGLSINSSYNNILDSIDSLKLAEESLDIRTQEYNVALIQYELGLITNSQLTGIMNSLTSTKIQLDNAKLTYKLAVEKYKYEISIGLGM